MRMPPRANSVGGRGGVRLSSSKLKIVRNVQFFKVDISTLLKSGECFNVESSSDENASASELCGRERRGEAPRQFLHVDRAHLADQSDQQLNLSDIIWLWNISTHLAPPDRSALVLAELLHHLVAQLARDVDALRGWHHRAHLVGDWDRGVDEDDIDVVASTG